MTPSPIRILLVEDSSADAELLLAELDQGGFRVEAGRVETAAEMAAALEAGGWDVVVSDCNLPSFSASAALALLKANGSDLPFIVVSGCVGEEAAAALMRAGAHDFIVKGNYFRLAPAIEREMRETKMRRERRLARQQLEASEKLLREITFALGAGILVQDREGRLVFMNPEAERLLGWSEMEFMGRDVHGAIHHLHGDGTPHPREDCPVLGVLSCGSFYRCEDDVFVRKDGTVFPVSYVATPLMDKGELVAAVTAFQDITERKQAENELKESRRQLRELSAFLQNAREEERRHIARELHDELGQALTALKIDLDWLTSHCPCGPVAKAKVPAKLADMSTQVARTVDSVRRIAQDLRPGMLDDLGLAAAIEWQVEQFQKRTGIHTVVTMNREEFTLSEQVATSVFRIIQEALTNAARHAGAMGVSVTIEEDGMGIRLEVRDDGTGFDLAAKPSRKSYGLLGIRERVNMLGGVVDISSVPGQGTAVQAWIPFEKIIRGQ